MSSMISNLLQGSAIYLSARVASSALIFFTLPILSRYIDQESLGMIMYFLAVIPLAGVIVFLGSESALVRLYYEYEDKNRVVTNVFAIIAGLFLFWSLFVCIQSAYFTIDIQPLLNLTFIYVVFYGINNHLLSFFRVTEKPTYYLCVTIFTAALFFISQIYVGVVYRDPYLIIIARTFVEIVVFLYALWFFYKHVVLDLVSLSDIKNILRYMLPIVPYTFALFAINVTDKLFIEHFLGLDALAIYGAAYTFIAIISVVSQSFDMAWGPYFYKSVSDTKRPEHLSKFISLFCGFLAMISVLIIIFSREIISLMYPEQYLQSHQVLIILMVGVYINAFFFFPVKSINYKKKNGYSAVIAVVVMLLNFALNYYLVQTLGIHGCAIATVISFTIFVGMLTIIGEKLYPQHYEYVVLLVFFLIVLVSAFISYTMDINIIGKAVTVLASWSLICILVWSRYRCLLRIV